jgi:outer membrane receptor protein involved in Fe transport
MKKGRIAVQWAAQIGTAVSMFLFWLSLAPVALGQGSAYITGYIHDQSQATVPNASVVITNEATNVSVTVKSSEVGLYRSPTLQPGTYSVTAEASGFKRLVRSGVVVSLGQPLGLDLQMELGEIGTEVKVTAEAPLLRSEEAGLGQSVEIGQISQLPFFNRSAGMLIQLSPGARYLGEDFISYGSSRYNVGGMGNTNVLVNGAGVTADRTDVGQMAYNPSVEALSEVRVLSNQYSAEFGQDVGALVLMQTKSGSNSLHGNVYEFFRNEALDTYSGFTRTKPKDRQHIFGGMVGGPIKKNNLFFYTNIEIQQQANPASRLLTVPTAAQKAGDFSALPQIIYDPATTRTDPATGRLVRDPFEGNIIPPNRLDAVAKNLLKYIPDPTLAGFTTNLPSASGIDNNKRRGVTRIDWNISEKDKLAGTWMWDRTFYNFRGFSAYNDIDPAASPTIGEAFGFKFLTQVYNFEETHLFSPTFFTTNRVVWRPYHILRINPSVDPAKKWGQTLGLKNTPGMRLPEEYGGDMGFPDFAFTGYTSLGGGGWLFQQKPQNMFNYYNATQYVRGAHALKFGFEAYRSLQTIPDQSGPNGHYTFDLLQTSQPGVAGTGNAFASFLLGLVNSASYALGPPQTWTEWYYATFIQDDWKVTPKLTLNLGLRWDIDAPVYETQSMGNSFDFEQINPVSGTRGVYTFLGQGGLPGNFYDTNWRRFAPRFGFAWQAKPRMVIRGGYGVYNTSPILGANRRAPGEGFVTTGSFGSPDGGLSPAYILQDGLPNYPLGGDPALLNSAFGAVRVGQTPTNSPRFVDRSWKFGYAQNFNLSIQHELPWNTLIEVAGQGVLGRNLPVNTNWNEIPPNLWGQTGSNFVRRPFPQFANVTEVKSQRGTTNYYAAYVRAEKRFSQGFSLISNYNWSKNVGFMGGSIYYPGLSRGPTWYDESNNPTGQAYHSGLISWIYELPAGRGKKYLNSGAASKVFGGWSINGILTLRSGTPFNLSSGADSLNGNSPLGGRVNLVGDPSAGAGVPDRWFNTAAFAAPAFGTIGNFCCGLLESPSNKILNVAISKDTFVNERWKIKFTAEFFNFTNTIPWGVPDTNLRSPTFGRILGPLTEGANTQGGGGQRIIQFGLRIEF